MTAAPGLDDARLHTLLDGGELWSDVRLVAATGSTNADLARLADAGAREGTVIATDDQTAGRGRLARTWVSPRGAGIAVSILLRPEEVARERWSWLPLLAGIAAVDALAELGVAAALKWPNDVLVADRKIAGILVEVADRGRAAVVGVGLNVSPLAGDLPGPAATSVGLELSAAVDPTVVLAALLRHTADWYDLWRTAEAAPQADGGVIGAAYAERSSTLGRAVTITLPAGGVRTGSATGIDANGALIVTNDTGSTSFHAGDVTHVR